MKHSRFGTKKFIEAIPFMNNDEIFVWVVNYTMFKSITPKDSYQKNLKHYSQIIVKHLDRELQRRISLGIWN